MASEEFSKGNHAFVDEDYEGALELYSKAIEMDPSKDNYFAARAHTHIKLENYKEAISDASKAIDLNSKNAKAYLRKGMASFYLGDFATAKQAFTDGSTHDESDKSFASWIRKCDAELDMQTNEPLPDGTKYGVGVAPAAAPTPQAAAAGEPATSISPSAPAQPQSMPATSKPQEISMPVVVKTRYDWYQTETHVVVTIMIKKVKKEDLQVDIQENTLSVTIKLPSGSDYCLELDLAHPVVPEQSTYKRLSTKVEIKLKKQEGIRWSALEGDGQETNVKQFNPDTGPSDSGKVPKYPSSSHYTRDWDKLVVEIKEEEKEEKLEGDAALNQLFQKIYADGTDEVKKAMNKSFSESGGTVLSTNWGEIGTKKTDVKSPDGMEYKSWEGKPMDSS